MKHQLSKVLGVTFFMVAAFAIAQDEAENGAEAKSEKVCVNSRTLNSFDALSDQHVFVEATGKNYYLFTMRNRCRNLDKAFGIAVSDTTSRVCSDSFGEIIYRDMGRRFESCRIGTIEPVSSKDEAREIIAARENAEDE